MPRAALSRPRSSMLPPLRFASRPRSSGAGLWPRFRSAFGLHSRSAAARVTPAAAFVTPPASLLAAAACRSFAPSAARAFRRGRLPAGAHAKVVVSSGCCVCAVRPAASASGLPRLVARCGLPSRRLRLVILAFAGNPRPLLWPAASPPRALGLARGHSPRRSLSPAPCRVASLRFAPLLKNTGRAAGCCASSCKSEYAARRSASRRQCRRKGFTSGRFAAALAPRAYARRKMRPSLFKPALRAALEKKGENDGLRNLDAVFQRQRAATRKRSAEFMDRRLRRLQKSDGIAPASPAVDLRWLLEEICAAVARLRKTDQAALSLAMRRAASLYAASTRFSSDAPAGTFRPATPATIAKKICASTRRSDFTKSM